MAALRPEAPGAEPATDSFADRVYGQLKSMAMQYRFRPGERLNEVEIAKQLGVSRTPLREALNRLETEGFLTSTLGKGFYCREIDPKEI
jgi:DNA-binding GntR family transcriptional regulator